MRRYRVNFGQLVRIGCVCVCVSDVYTLDRKRKEDEAKRGICDIFSDFNRIGLPGPRWRMKIEGHDAVALALVVVVWTDRHIHRFFNCCECNERVEIRLHNRPIGIGQRKQRIVCTISGWKWRTRLDYSAILSFYTEGSSNNNNNNNMEKIVFFL